MSSTIAQVSPTKPPNHLTRVLNKHVHGIPPGARFIGRGSCWGNPFVIGPDGTRPEVVAKYKAWVINQSCLMTQLDDLRGHDQVCFCAPRLCHGTTLRDLANRPRLQADGLVEHLDCSTGEITYLRAGSDQDGELWKQHRVEHLRSLVGCYQAESGRIMTPREDAAWEAILAEAIADAMTAGADGPDIQAATA